MARSPLDGRDHRPAPIERRFYQRDTRSVACDLLGKLLVRDAGSGLEVVRLVDVEAYLGIEDPACHTFRGRRTARVEAMWGEAGHLYVYFTYGMHHCANVVTAAAGVPEAVLLRGAVPLRGMASMLARRRGRGGKDLLAGPARLCQALAINRSLNGADLAAAGPLWLADDGVRCPPEAVLALPRVGVAYAGEAASWLLRFAVDLEAPAAPAVAARGSLPGRAGAPR